MKHLITNLILLAVFGVFTTACSDINLTNEKKSDPLFQGYIENTQVNVTTRMPGRIVDILVDEGDVLKEGDTVALLDTREIKENRKALMAKLHNVAVNKRRLEHLYKAGAVPLQKLDEVTTGYEMLKAKISALDTRISDMVIKAPMDGVVTLKVLEKNQMMPPGMPVVIETDPQGTWARFSIPETYLNQIKLGDKVNLTTNAGDLTLKGKIIQIIPMASFATHTPTSSRDERDVRTFDVKILILDHQKDINPGMSVFLKLKPVNHQAQNSKQ
jgi:HlyD family secretion protein